MKLFNWINPLWIIETFLTTRLEPASATTAAMAAPSILGGGMTGAGMMTVGAPVVPGILASSTPGLMSGLGALGSGALSYAKDNPFQTLGLGMNVYDRMNPSQAPLQPSAMQQLMRQQQAVPPAEFNSILQLPRKPIYIG
jgi:hypothetical protein